MPLRVLVTGGAGFIGSHVVDRLVEAGHEVRVLDVLHVRAHGEHPDYLNPGVEYIWGDLADVGVVRGSLDGVDAVCHQASMVGLGRGFRDVVDYVRSNDLGTAVLLGALAEIRFGGRLVLASSMVVYGEGRWRCPEHGILSPGPRDPAKLDAGRFDPVCPRCAADLEPEAVPENAALDPRNVYAATKVHQEHLCFVYGRECAVPVTALRYHNVYGPRMPKDTPYSGVAAIFRSALEAGRAPQVFEDGRQLRDFVHVRDVAAANVLALTRYPPPTGAFNVASGRPRTVGEMASALSDAFGPTAPVPETTGRYRLGDVRHVFASPASASEVLGFEASVAFGDGMEELARAPMRDVSRHGERLRAPGRRPGAGAPGLRPRPAP
ncbi:NAD-dependent epimerase/dehydratase family protein [soil metagenome]